MRRRRKKGYKKSRPRKRHIQQTKYTPPNKKTYRQLVSKALVWLLLSVAQQIAPSGINYLLKELEKVLPHLLNK